MKWAWIVAVACFLVVEPVWAEETTPPSETTSAAPVTDPAKVGAYYQQLVKRPEFQEIEKPDVDLRLKEWLSRWFTRLGAKLGGFQYASEMPAFAQLLMSLLVVMAVAGFLYVTIRLTRRKRDWKTPSSMETPGQKVFHSPEFYDEEIQQAVREENWHTAWLATWRQFLSRLENRHLVEADRTRTNREYLMQLREQTLPASALALLTGMVESYDRFIYGKKLIGEPDWTLFHQQANEAALMLHLDDKLRPRGGAS